MPICFFVVKDMVYSFISPERPLVLGKIRQKDLIYNRQRTGFVNASVQIDISVTTLWSLMKKVIKNVSNNEILSGTPSYTKKRFYYKII